MRTALSKGVIQNNLSGITCTSQCIITRKTYEKLQTRNLYSSRIVSLKLFYQDAIKTRMTTVYEDALAAGTELDNYRIVRTLGTGGFGITYLATDLDLNANVAIKEYMPSKLAVRVQSSLHVTFRTDNHRKNYDFGLGKFLEEAQTLARFNERNIISIKRFFKANNTAYIVMDYEDGQSLQDYLDCRLNRPSEKKLRSITIPILHGLGAIHSHGFLHRDIKPSNIYLRKNGEPVLLDFGSARQSLSDLSGSLTEIVTPGYSPLEQYSAKGKQGPWTDLYSIGATLYRCLSGSAPAVSASRIVAMEEGSPDPLVSALELGEAAYSETFLAAVDWMLKPIAKDRPQNVDEILIWLETDSETTSCEETEKVVRSHHGIHPAEANSTQTKTDKIHFNRRANDHAELKQGDGKVVDKPESRPFVLKKVILVVTVTLLAATGVLWMVREPADDEPIDDKQTVIPSDNKSNQIDLLLVKANNELNASHLTEPSGASALDHFKEILKLDSGNSDALKGIEEIIQSHIDKAQSAILETRFSLARSYIDKTRWILSEVGHLNEMSKYVTEADKKLLHIEEDRRKQLEDKKRVTAKQETDKKIKLLLAKAEQDLKAFRLTTPTGENALERFYLVLDADPENELAKKGIDRIVNRYRQLAAKSINREQFDKAETYLVKARKVDPNSTKLREMFDQLAIARKKVEDEKLKKEQEIAARRKLESVRAQKREQIAKLLKLADNDIKTLRLTIPKTNNALERYKSLLQLELGNLKALEAIERITNKTGSLEILGNGSETELLLNSIKFKANEYSGSRIILFPGWYALKLLENGKVLQSERVLIKVGELSRIRMQKSKQTEIPPRIYKRTPKRVPLPPP